MHGSRAGLGKTSAQVREHVYRQAERTQKSFLNKGLSKKNHHAELFSLRRLRTASTLVRQADTEQRRSAPTELQKLDTFFFGGGQFTTTSSQWHYVVNLLDSPFLVFILIQKVFCQFDLQHKIES